MPRLPFKICVLRLVGTPTFRASSAALISSASSSVAKCSPGWIAVSPIENFLCVTRLREATEILVLLDLDDPVAVESDKQNVGREPVKPVFLFASFARFA